MMVLVSYDVSTADKAGASRLRRVAKKCQDFGVRVQYSVFECNVNPAQWTMLKSILQDIINPATDSLRYYYLGDNYQRKVEHFGAKPVVDVQDDLLMI